MNREAHMVAAGIVATDNDATGWHAPAAVEKAVKTLTNGVRGYETVASHVDDSALSTMLHELGKARSRTVADVLRAATDLGIDFEADTDGTAAGAVHRAWIVVESELAGDDSAVESAKSGEEHAIEQLTEALENDMPEELADALRKALSDVEEAKQRLQAWIARR